MYSVCDSFLYYCIYVWRTGELELEQHKKASDLFKDSLLDGFCC